MKAKKAWSCAQVMTLCVLLFLLAFLVLNLRLIRGPLARLVKRESDFPQFITEVQTAYTSQPAWKEQFVNLNGLFSRLTGRRVCNDAILLNNGMLCSPSPEEQYVYWVADNVVHFAGALAEEGVPFLYVQAPCKADLEGQLLPEGVDFYANADADNLLNYLTVNGVFTMDLRPGFSATAEQVERNFFRTDHHWTFEAALRALPVILGRMDELLPDRTLDTANAAFDQWEAHTLEDWFLGSLGKRTGVCYGGVDDMTYYTPKFETHISQAVLNHQMFSAGDFVQADMRMEYAQRRDYFNDSPYCIYVGGDYPLVQYRNAGAPNKLRLLLIKDSFSLPLQCYLSTLFTEVDVIDPRYTTAGMGSVAQYAALNQPDFVVMMLNPVGGLGSEEYAAFGTQMERARESALTGARTVIFQGDVELPMSENAYAYFAVDAALEPGGRYTFHCGRITFLEGGAASGGVMAALFDKDTEAFVNGRIFDVDFCNGSGGFTWRFDVPEGEAGQFQLLLYAGMPGHTQGIELTYRSASLTLEE